MQPVIDPQTRTLQVRIELPNPDGLLRPGLFGDVIITRNASSDVLTVPRSAVLDSGTRQIVLVQVGEGRFEPRKVVVGERSGDMIEVREGLRTGERVVVSANFLIDAESNLQSALDGMSAGREIGPAKAESGSPVADDAAGAASEHQHGDTPAADLPAASGASDPAHAGHSGMAMPEPEPEPVTHAGHDSQTMEH